MRKNAVQLASIALVCLGVWLTAGGCEKIESENTITDKKVESLIASALTTLEQARIKREQAQFNDSAAAAKQRDADWSKNAAPDPKTTPHDAGRLSAEARDHSARAKALWTEAAKLQNEAGRLLTDAAKDPKTSKALQAAVKSFHAQADYDSAMVLLSDVEPALLDAHRLMWETSRLGARIGINNAAIAVYTQQNPDSAPAKVEGAAPAVAPLKAAADERAKLVAANTDLDAKLNDQKGKVSAKETEVKNLTDLKNGEEARAVELLRKSEAAKGDESLKLFEEGQDARAKSQAAVAKLDIATIELADLQRDLARLQDDRAQNDQAITKIDAQTSIVKAAWVDTEKARKELTDESKKILGESGAATANPSDASTITDKAKALRDILQKIADKRAAAAKLLEDADAQFDQAAKAAEGARTEVTAQIAKLDPESGRSSGASGASGEAPSRRAVLQQFQKLNSPAAFRMARATVFAAKGDLEAGKAQLFSRLVEVLAQLKSVTDAGMTIPTDLTAFEAQGALPKATDAAKAAYNLADETAKGLLEDADYGSSARTLQMFVWYGLYQVTKDDKYLKDAQSAYARVKASYAQDNRTMPAVAADLDQRPLVLPQIPTTGPATEPSTPEAVPPATAPSDPGAAPADPGAAPPATAPAISDPPPAAP